jgi:anaerobic magnesium-protoporphyrin IX monomethyl ester cyclase
MRYALVNPNWTFNGSIYFGCREPHLPLEYGYAKILLEQAGHEAIIIDGHLWGLSRSEIRKMVADFQPDFTVVSTAPTYLFWRCPPPELRVPQETVLDLRNVAGTMIAVGPHGSTTPRTTLRKLGVDVIICGEFEDLLAKLPENSHDDRGSLSSFCFADDMGVTPYRNHSVNMTTLPPLRWSKEEVDRHLHQHHRFDAAPLGPGAEVEASRGCPYHCTFCARENFRNRYRRRPLPSVLREIDGLLSLGVEYIYFIDEIFLPDKDLLEALLARKLKFGVQMRIDLWDEETLELLGLAGCVSIEAGVESISEQGLDTLNKNSRISLSETSKRLIHAKKHVPFVQANLIATDSDDPEAVEKWRNELRQHGVWANKPVPLFPYPGSPLYRQYWGSPDERAWERAHEKYLSTHSDFSDIQEQKPIPLAQLEMDLHESVCSCYIEKQSSS